MYGVAASHEGSGSNNDEEHDEGRVKAATVADSAHVVLYSSGRWDKRGPLPMVWADVGGCSGGEERREWNEEFQVCYQKRRLLDSKE